jgi:hypothetical protein
MTARAPGKPFNRRRRHFLNQSAVAGACLVLPCVTHGAETAAIKGDVRVNGQRLTAGRTIMPGDNISTAAGSMFTFAVGKDAFMMRQLTTIMLESQPDSAIVTGLRLVTGALVGVFGSGMRMVHTGLVVAAIRGTGIYLETNTQRTYFCTCYGEVELSSASVNAKKTVTAQGHAANYVYAGRAADRTIVQAPMMNHRNDELAALERLAGRAPVLK